MKQLFYFLFFTLVLNQIRAQEASRFIQSADDFGLDNPSGLSFEEMRYRGTVLSGSVRNQWWSGEGYPRTEALSWLDTRHERYHWGAAFVADKIGETRALGIQGRYAHTIAEGLKLGVSAAGLSQHVDIKKLDQYDANDPVALAAGEAQWKLVVSTGLFYYRFHPEERWNWFAGIAFRHALPLDKLPGGEETPAESDLLLQGGLGWSSWWLGGRMRYSWRQPGALDLYARKYFFKDQYFLGGIVTSDHKFQTAGIQIGMERVLQIDDSKGNHYLAVSLGLSKPLSNYVQGNTLILDGRVVWIWERKL